MCCLSGGLLCRTALRPLTQRYACGRIRKNESRKTELVREEKLYFSETLRLLIVFVEEKDKKRAVLFYKEYFQEFFSKQRPKVQDKIIWTLTLLEELSVIPETYLKHIENTDGLYELRIQQGNDIFRIFCFFDEGRLVILVNGFQKKTQKTPRKEIEKALKLKEEYESERK